MGKELAKTYEPNEVEARIYDFWLEGGYFSAKADPQKKPFTMVMPPPNITGKLHIGHALNSTLQDIIIRFKRMQGYSALWVPGTDHASIATEVKIQESLKEEGLSKENLGREEFLKRAWAWKEKYGSEITHQLKKIGVSCDWTRERFTLDDGCSRAVTEVFVKLFNKGLICRGDRMINWCSACKTSISDAEVRFIEKQGTLWHIKYPLSGGATGYLEIATTRPETMLGDTALAVNPSDDRYRHLVGKTAIIPLVGREIPIIADNYAEISFGTGVVKITPAHDNNDFEVGLRHDLPLINVINDDGFINENGGKYSKMKTLKAREAIICDLTENGFLVKTEAIDHNVGVCYRCKTAIEPRISKQWFVKMQPLAGAAIDCSKQGEVKFVPDRFEKVYIHWLENIKDWCISRQLWWGHRIPAYYCQDCSKITVSAQEVSVCPECKSKKIKQDEDVLDTWFSSALWPFSILGWPGKTPDFNYFYPTDALVTGYDIIFFWVIRMVFSALEHTGKIPFRTVLLHGLVRDEHGQKMSKSLGNGIDPLDIIKKYGTDSLRFALADGAGPGNDIRFSYGKLSSGRNFTNKLWNAARFIRMNIENTTVPEDLPDTLATEEEWIVNSFNSLTKSVTENLEKFELGLALEKVYDFTWNIFCDWYIEFAKVKMQDEKTASSAKCVLVWIIKNILKLLHPFMPFITEEIFSSLPHSEKALIIADYPQFKESLCFEDKMKKIMEAIKAIRNRRAEMNVPPSRKTTIYITTAFTEDFIKCSRFFEKLASGSEVIISQEDLSLKNSLTIITASAKIYIPLGELVDKNAEITRLKKELLKCEKQVKDITVKLSNEKFLALAPPEVINGVKASLVQLQQKISKINAEIIALGGETMQFSEKEGSF